MEVSQHPNKSTRDFRYTACAAIGRVNLGLGAVMLHLEVLAQAVYEEVCLKLYCVRNSDTISVEDGFLCHFFAVADVKSQW